MKEYNIDYEIAGRGTICVVAESEDDAMEEVNRIFGGDAPLHEENQGITQEDLFDIEWNTADATNAEAVNPMKYIRANVSNGFCGCDEEFLMEFSEKVPDCDISEFVFEAYS